MPLSMTFANSTLEVPGLRVDCEFVSHPGLTLSDRLSDDTSTVTYSPIMITNVRDSVQTLRS